MLLKISKWEYFEKYSNYTFSKALAWIGISFIIFSEAPVLVVFNKPSVARAVLQTPDQTLILCENTLKYLHSQTVRAGELKFWFTSPNWLHVMCNMSCVMCHLSHVTCHVSDCDKVVKLVGEGYVINGPTPSTFKGTWSSNIFICTSSIICVLTGGSPGSCNSGSGLKRLCELDNFTD